MASTTPATSHNASTTSSNSSSLHLQNFDDLKRVFNQFDTNGDGKISLDELGDVLKSMGSTYTQAELDRVMKDVDADKDGFINLEEFSHLCRSSSGVSDLRDAFDLYDQNKDGLISSAELHKVLNSLGIRCSAEECVKMISSVDSDGDGSVNFEEFQKMMATNNRDVAVSS
ncbi:hypothetical protein K2173_027346 [Erythroxylum novogranatense]|uniref:EF-hand domain-containing protein n=1 Tax=Erythroxylum novogranatense TaxID=1862640 RepID=A0AAV8U222_9ROSI|nr:hypothetical protein K2173_027346 [Erythroxylum novogranatense]